MRYPTLDELKKLHHRIVTQSGGSLGIRDLASLESAIHQPYVTFGGVELHASFEEKAAALGFSIVMSHPFIDGNKRVGHAAMEAFLMLNGYQLKADVDDAEELILRLAAGQASKAEVVEWIRERMSPRV